MSEARKQDAGGDGGFSDRVRAAQAEIATAVGRAGLLNDPYRHVMEAQSKTIGVFPDFVEHLDEALDRARAPVDAALVERIAKEAATEIPFVLRQQVGLFIQQETRKQARHWALVCLGIAIGAFVAGVGFDYWYHPSLTTQVCRTGTKQLDAKTQRPVCSISLWAD